MNNTNPHKPRLFLTALLLGLLAVSNSAAADSSTGFKGDAAAGAGKSIFCSYCHGYDGNPHDGRAPRLAGQNAGVLYAKMKRDAPYRYANHPMLQAFVTGGCLNDQDMRNLAAFYASQPVRQTPAGKQ